MSAMFSIIADPARDLIRIVASGFFTMADVASFDEALERARAELRCAPLQHLTFADASAMHIQSQDVVTAFSKIASDPQRRSRRTAMVVGHSLARSQAKRISKPGSDHIAYFHDSDAAEAWLFSDAPAGIVRMASRDRRAPASQGSNAERTASPTRRPARSTSKHTMR